MNLLTDKWVRVKSNNGFKRVSITESMSYSCDDIEFGRRDFNFSFLFMMIGMKQTGYEPDDLLGENHRFMQHIDAKNGRELTIGQLLLDEPGENAVKKNTDVFMRGNQRNSLCKCCTTLALFTKQNFGGPLGPGLYPSMNFHSTIYLVKKNTISETIDANLVNEKISQNAYFYSANNYWLGAAVEGQCAICNEFGMIFKTVYRHKVATKPVHVTNPNVATTPDGLKFSIAPSDSILKLIDGVSENSEISIRPTTFDKSKIGDDVIAFSTNYDKASLRSIHIDEIKIREKIEWDKIRLCVHQVLRFHFSHRDLDLDDYKSTLATEVRRNITRLIFMGYTERHAASEIFNQYCLNFDGFKSLKNRPRFLGDNRYKNPR